MILDEIWGGIGTFFKSITVYLCKNPDVIGFSVVSLIAIVAALYVVTSKEIMHSAFYLALVFVCVAITYYFLEAEFIGAVQLIVYVGAITMLFAFSIMLVRRTIMSKRGDNDE
ncbi:MAG: NADH-quinone oxidoreductase subunit J [archaeon]|nr:NADH-quinone oxidoreductase subunit J [archaeon]